MCERIHLSSTIVKRDIEMDQIRDHSQFDRNLGKNPFEVEAQMIEYRLGKLRKKFADLDQMVNYSMKLYILS